MSILAVATNGTTTVIGCDGRSTLSGGHIVESRATKWLLKDRIALGCAGFGRFQLVAEEVLDRLDSDMIVRRPQLLFDEIRTALKADEWATGDAKTGPPVYDSTALLTFGNKIWRVDADLTSYYVERNFWAIGAGEDYAMGAMFARRTWTNGPLDLVMMGLKAATEFHAFCGGELWWREL